jgi:AraC family transcriptional regulator of adaptative response/methylated-DNA-[protein]-cysteine methyltransferase
MIFSQKIKSPLGILTAFSTDDGICLLSFDNDKDSGKEYSILEKHFGPVCEGTNRHLKTLIHELDEYFRGTLKEFSVPLVTSGTAFQESVWKELMNIKYGETRSYLEQSIALGKPESIRAVANANGMNRISIVIPCHRVIGSNGSLTGYGGGLERKKWLLEHEKRYSGKSYEPVLF